MEEIIIIWPFHGLLFLVSVLALGKPSLIHNNYVKLSYCLQTFKKHRKYLTPETKVIYLTCLLAHGIVLSFHGEKLYKPIKD